jgi:L-threonylcarbamoyladenylate synthase
MSRSQWHIMQAARYVRQGGVIAYPTEAVWGIGCDPANDDAIQRILALKSRPAHKGLVVVAADLSQLDDWLLPLHADDLAQIAPTWPGPVSWVLPCKPEVSPLLRGQHSSLAVRITDHPLVQALCQEVGPLVSTSANPAGKEPARTPLRVRQYFRDQLDAIVPGQLGGNSQPSQIRTLDGQRLR